MAGLLVNCDWGTSRLRLRVVRLPEVELAAELSCDEGVARLAAHDASSRPAVFRQTLHQSLSNLARQFGQPLDAAPCFISGMASSSVGWRELPYATVPLPLDASGLKWTELDPLAGADGPHRVFLLSGLATGRDVMRGEETELVGLFQLPGFQDLAARALVIMPGTHSKHVTVDDHRVTDFQTFMTGELYDVLGEHSILRHSITHVASPADSLQGHQPEFRSGVQETQSRPLSAALFRVRTRQLLDGLAPSSNRGFLSGLLIGGELAYLARDEGQERPIVLAATEPLATAYHEACQVLGLSERVTALDPADAARLSALGQARLWRHLS